MFRMLDKWKWNRRAWELEKSMIERRSLESEEREDLPFEEQMFVESEKGIEEAYETFNKAIDLMGSLEIGLDIYARMQGDEDIMNSWDNAFQCGILAASNMYDLLKYIERKRGRRTMGETRQFNCEEKELKKEKGNE